MLSLRAKLVLGIGSLLLIALILGVYGILQVNRLGPAIDVILRENYRSVLAMQRAKEALERQDSGTLYALLGEQEAGADLRSKYDPEVREALSTELGNITLDGERERAERLDSLYQAYQAALDRIFDPTRAVADRRAFYFDRVQPLFLTVKDEANAILDMNQEHMASASEAARQKAASARQRMLILLLGGGVLALVVTTVLSRSLLRPIRQVTESAEEIQRGNLDVAVPETGGKELARLAQVRRLPPRAHMVAAREPDLNTVSALVRGRVQVMAFYARDVLLPTLRHEAELASGQCRRRLRRARASLIREQSLVAGREERRLTRALAQSQRLTTVYQYRLRLQQLWAGTQRHSSESLLQALRSWCADAEATGIQALVDFAQRLRGFSLTSARPA